MVLKHEVSMIAVIAIAFHVHSKVLIYIYIYILSCLSKKYTPTLLNTNLCNTLFLINDKRENTSEHMQEIDVTSPTNPKTNMDNLSIT